MHSAEVRKGQEINCNRIWTTAYGYKVGRLNSSIRSRYLISFLPKRSHHPPRPHIYETLDYYSQKVGAGGSNQKVAGGDPHQRRFDLILIIYG